MSDTAANETTVCGITVTVKEYDDVDGCCQCVQFGEYGVSGTSGPELRRFLAEGDYSEGGSERYVEVYSGDRLLGTWTAPEIRRCAAALRGAAKRTGKRVVTGC